MTGTLVVAAPPRLDSESRVDFRCAALDCLERLGRIGGEALTIDLAKTRDVDASGLGTLVLVHKRARERGFITRLLHTPHAIRMLLTTTRLEPLFEFESDASVN